MTPEERAAQLKQALREWRTSVMRAQGRVSEGVLCVMDDDEAIERLAANVIQDAVAEEREACAKIADAEARASSGEDFAVLATESIAAAIRARATA